MAGADVKEFTVFGLKMWQQVLICLVLGIITGFVLHADAAPFKVLGVIFIDLIKMVVVPLIFLALTSGITSMAGSATCQMRSLRLSLERLHNVITAMPRRYGSATTKPVARVETPMPATIWGSHKVTPYSPTA